MVFFMVKIEIMLSFNKQCYIWYNIIENSARNEYKKKAIKKTIFLIKSFYFSILHITAKFQPN